ncbi:hypothetical protein Tco_0705218 [Tanacetum coccineum]|uniref:Uncharacterized protein n=1 Tax=Tanacetum coccineum TaxID=301880 RepID=A0ABQ4Y4V6_9ASTR
MGAFVSGLAANTAGGGVVGWLPPQPGVVGWLPPQPGVFGLAAKQPKKESMDTIMPEDPYAYIMAAYQVPPSPDYIPGPEEPQSPPLLDFVPEPMYPE